MRQTIYNVEPFEDEQNPHRHVKSTSKSNAFMPAILMHLEDSGDYRFVTISS